MIDTVAFPGTQSTWYFTGTQTNPNTALFLVSFGTGVIYNDQGGELTYVRCVHAATTGGDAGP